MTEGPGKRGSNPKILRRESPQKSVSPHPISLPQSQFFVSSFSSDSLLSIVFSLPLPLGKDSSGLEEVRDGLPRFSRVKS